MSYTLLVDMDEVLCDFISGACKANEVSRQELEARRIPGEWAIHNLVNELRRERLCTGFDWEIQAPLDQFWSPITEQGEDFWVNLEPLPWANTLITFIGDLCYCGLLKHKNWHVVTAPSKCPSSYSGKVKWLKNFFGSEFDRFCITPHKHIFAKPDAILIDDREENITAFEKNGGIGVLFPSRGNLLHLCADNPIPHVLGQLQQILKG